MALGAVVLRAQIQGPGGRAEWRGSDQHAGLGWAWGPGGHGGIVRGSGRGLCVTVGSQRKNAGEQLRGYHTEGSITAEGGDEAGLS